MTTTKPTVEQAKGALGILAAYLADGGSPDAIMGTSTSATATPTPLDKRLYVFPYKAGSKSAEALAKALNVLRLNRTGSTFVGKVGQFVLNWGAGTGNFNANVGGARVLNPPELVDKAINKREFFTRMLGDGGPRMPFWTVSDAQAKAWLASGYTVIARDSLEGSKGEGIRVMKNPVDFRTGKLYTILVPSTTEYRVYVFNGKAVDAREKRLKSGATADANGLRYDEEKYLFCEHINGSLGTNLSRIFPNLIPADVVTQAEKAAAKLGLLTGGVDVLYDGQRAFVLEYNTAPYLGDHTAAVYAKLLKEYVANNPA